MKAFIVVALLLASSVSYARQYIQCSDRNIYSTEVAVVNLVTEAGGTLFLSSGMQNSEDERILLQIAFDKAEDGFHFYKVINNAYAGSVRLPSDVVGKRADFLIVDVNYASFSISYSCFARIYND